jgi:inorganic triphosphatase YgiF
LGEETEIKLNVSQRSLAKIADAEPIRKHQAAAKRATNIVTVCYDTQKRHLRKNGITLRLRRQGDKFLQTVKADAGAFPRRKEWEFEVDDNELDFAATKDTPLEPLLKKKVRRQLRPLFESRVRRTVIPLKWHSSKIELGLDRGQFKAKRRHASISEAELELKDGKLGDLFAAARALAKAAPVQLGMLSKADVGYRLADGDLDRPSKSVPVALSRKLNAAEAFCAVAQACLRQITANEGAVDSARSEGVHQMRVGLRRLRTAPATFPISPTVTRMSNVLRAT